MALKTIRVKIPKCRIGATGSVGEDRNDREGRKSKDSLGFSGN